MIVTNEIPVAKHSISFVDKPVKFTRKVLNNKSKSWLPISKIKAVQQIILASIKTVLVCRFIPSNLTIVKTA